MLKTLWRLRTVVYTSVFMFFGLLCVRGPQEPDWRGFVMVAVACACYFLDGYKFRMDQE